VEDQLPAGGRAVDRLCQGADADATCGEAFYGLDELREGTRKPVELPHDNGVAGPGEIERGFELGAVETRAGGGFVKYSFAAGGEKSVPLKCAILGPRC